MNDAARTEQLIPLERRDVWIPAGLLALVIVALWPVLAAGPDRAPGLPDHDARTQWYPWRLYAADALREGRLPLWNPHILCGTPFLGNFQSAVLYPPNLLYLALSPATATKALIVLHLWLSSVLAWLLARALGAGRWAALAGGIAFAFCGPQLLRVPAGHWGVTCAIPWLAAVVLCAEWAIRRPGLWPFLAGTGAVALQVLSGVPQYVLITALTAGGYAALRVGFDWPGARGALLRLGLVAGFLVMGGCLAGIQLWPGLEAAGAGARSLPMRAEWARQFSLGPECLLTMLVPGLFGGVEGHLYWGRYFYWEMNAYFGVAALALALYGLAAGRPRRLAWALGAGAGIALLLSLGRHTPAMGLLGAVMPFGDALRGASKFLLPFALAASALAALGLDALLRAEPERRRWMTWIGIGLPAAMLLALMAMPSLQEMVKRSGERLTPARVATAGSMTVYLLLWGLAMALAASPLVILRMRGAAARLAPTAAAGILALDAVAFSWMFVGGWGTFSARGSAWPAGAGEALRRAGSDIRAWAIGSPELNDAMIERVLAVEGIEPNPPARFHLLFRASQGLPGDIAPSLYQVQSGGAVTDRLACGRVVAPMRMSAAPEGRRILAAGERWTLLETRDVVPRAALYYRARYAPEAPDALAATLGADPRREVVIESAAPDRTPGIDRPPQPVVFLRDAPEEVVLRVHASASGWLVLRDNFFPGWQAEVNGAPVEIVPADFAFRAVRLEAGEHTVAFRYRPAMLRVGAASSLCAALACLLAAGLAWRRRAPSGNDAEGQAPGEAG